MSEVVTRSKLDSSENLIIVENLQDCEPILEHNAALRSEKQKSDWGRHVATIPNVVLIKWANEEWSRGNTNFKMYGKEFDALVAKKLADPDWKWLRVDK